MILWMNDNLQCQLAHTIAFWQLWPNTGTEMNLPCNILHLHEISICWKYIFVQIKWHYFVAEALQEQNFFSPAVPDLFTPQVLSGAKIPPNMFCLVFFISLFTLLRTPVSTLWPVPPAISPVLTFDFRLWLTFGRGWCLREAAVPQWSTTLFPSIALSFQPSTAPSPPPSHLTELKIEGSAGLQAACGDRGLSSRGRNGDGGQEANSLSVSNR